MNLAADVGRHSGRATPSLHDTPHRHFEETTGRQSTYLLPITVQTNRATSLLGGIAIPDNTLKAKTFRRRNFKYDPGAHDTESHIKTRKGIPKRTQPLGVIH